jgi:hypothetical protein
MTYSSVQLEARQLLPCHRDREPMLGFDQVCWLSSPISICTQQVYGSAGITARRNA